MRHYLLTGSTGAVGSAILKLLFEKGEKVSFLLRAKSDIHFKERVEKLLEFCQIRQATDGLLFPVKATLTENQFGLDDAEYKVLTKRCTHIVHCAASVNFRKPLDKALHESKTITENVLNFMGALENKGKMEHVSTVGVAGKAKGPLLEEWVTDNREFRNSYEASKALSEEMVKEKVDAGWDITVHRPSMVVGNSKTGEIISFQIFYYLCELLSGIHTFGVLPDLKNHYLDTVPSDYVASVIYWSSLQKDPGTRFIHTCSGESGGIYFNELGKLVSQLFNKHRKQRVTIKIIPLSVFKILIGLIKRVSPSHLKKSMNALPLFFAYLDKNQSFSNSKTLASLANSGISLPSNDTYLQPVLEYYLNSKNSRFTPR